MKARNAPITQARVLGILPPALQDAARKHPYHGETADYVQELAVAMLTARAGETPERIAARARSCARRFTQDPAHCSCSMNEELTDADADAAANGGRKGDAAREIAERARITVRAAQLRIKRQRVRARAGDLFGAEGRAA